MKDFMDYKGYIGSCHYSDDDEIFYGKLEGIRGLISYEGETAKELKKSFQEAVDEYLVDCKNEGIEPQKPFKGSFNIRVGSNLHKKIATIAAQKETSINNVVKEALEKYVA